MLSELPFPMPVLETQRLRLRRFEQRDLEAGFAWASDEEVTRYVYWPAHRTLNDTQNFLNSCFREYSQKGVGPWAMVLKDSGEQIGNCSFGLIHAADSRIEIAYFLARHHWGKGLACEAVTELLRFGFEDLQANRMEARCMIANTASERVMQKAGMTYEGILREFVHAKGKFHDLKVYSVLRHEWLARKASG